MMNFLPPENCCGKEEKVFFSLAIVLKMAVAYFLNEARVFWHFLILLKELWPPQTQNRWPETNKKGLTSESRLGTFFESLISNVWCPLS